MRGTKRSKIIVFIILIIIIFSFLNIKRSSKILDPEIAREIDKIKYIPSQERIEAQRLHLEELREVYPDISMAEIKYSTLEKLLANIGVYGKIEPEESRRGIYVIKNGTVPDPGDFSASGVAAFGRAGGIEGARVEWFYRESPENKWKKFRESRTNEVGFDAVILKKTGEYKVVAQYKGKRGETFWRITRDFMLTSAGVSSAIIRLEVP